MKQKTIFTSGEGDKWYERNEDALLNKDFSQDLIVEEIIDLMPQKYENLRDKSLVKDTKKTHKILDELEASLV